MIHFRGAKSTVSSIVTQSSTTTIPIVVDDVASPHTMEELAVQLTSGASHSTLKSGTNTPKTSIITTANFSFTESDRYYNFTVNACKCYINPI